MPQNFTLAKTWNGSLVSQEDRVHIEIQHSDPLTIRIEIIAPYYNNPPPSGAVGSHWGLWEHDVVEIFFVGSDGHYIETEFGPHGHYLILQLDKPRHIIKKDLTCRYQSRVLGNRWKGEVELSRSILPQDLDKINLFAIFTIPQIKNETAALPSSAAVTQKRRHLLWGTLPGEDPDFHQPQHFPQCPDLSAEER